MKNKKFVAGTLTAAMVASVVAPVVAQAAPAALKVEKVVVVDAGKVKVKFTNSKKFYTVKLSKQLWDGNKSVTFTLWGKTYTSKISKFVDVNYTAAVKAVAAYKAAPLTTLAEVEAAKKLEVAANEALAKVKNTSSARVNGQKGLVVAQAAIVAAKEAELSVPAVVSVTAVNAKHLVVKFNKAVDAKTLFVDPTAETTKLLNDVFTKETTALNGGYDAVLSTDGKSLTITASTNWEGTYLFKLAKDTVKATDGKFVGEYAEKFSFEDTVAPSILGTEQVNAGKVKVKFAEPIKSIGVVTAKLADGTTVVPTVEFTAGNDYAYLTLTTDAGKSVTYTFVGALDYSDNLLSPNPATVTVAKGAKDGVKPEVASLTTVNSKKFEIKLSEQVMVGADDNAVNFTKEDISVTGATISKVTQDTTDKTKFVVEVNENLNGKLATVSILADEFEDLTGEANKAFSKVVEFKEDSVKPSFAAAAVTKDSNGNEFLTLTLSEDVSLADAQVNGSNNAELTLNAKSLKDYVTTPGVELKIAAGKLVRVENTKNQFKVLLSDVATLVKDTAYTVDLGAGLFVDNAGLTNDAKTAAFSFVRGTDTNTVKSGIDKTFDAAEAGNLVKENGIKVSADNNNTLQIKFDNAVDGATATNKANYYVAGATVESATLLAGNIVELKLVKDSNVFTGLRTIKVSGVKSSTGVLVPEYSTTEYLKENVRETVVSAAVSSIVVDTDLVTPGNQELTTVTLTFSDVLNAVGAATDFDLYIKGVKDATAVTTTAVSGNKVTVTFAKALTATDFNNKVELKAATATIDIVDAAGNVVNVANPVELKLN
jgi:hypothetical protein